MHVLRFILLAGSSSHGDELTLGSSSHGDELSRERVAVQPYDSVLELPLEYTCPQHQEVGVSDFQYCRIVGSGTR
jgi:hypothetical protein